MRARADVSPSLSTIVIVFVVVERKTSLHTFMEENLLNELENFASIKYLDNVTNNTSNGNCCSDEDHQVSSSHFDQRERQQRPVNLLG